MTNTAPQGNPGDIITWPMLKIVYRTDPDALARLLPPGIEPGEDPKVFLTFYSFPVLNEPELGLVMTAAADFNGVQGEYALGYAIDQEAAVYVSREHWGQPKYLGGHPLLPPDEPHRGGGKACRTYLRRVQWRRVEHRRGGRGVRNERVVDQGRPQRHHGAEQLRLSTARGARLCQVPHRLPAKP